MLKLVRIYKFYKECDDLIWGMVLEKYRINEHLHPQKILIYDRK